MWTWQEPIHISGNQLLNAESITEIEEIILHFIFVQLLYFLVDLETM
jgi:hypothetical protein